MDAALYIEAADVIAPFSEVGVEVLASDTPRLVEGILEPTTSSPAGAVFLPVADRRFKLDPAPLIAAGTVHRPQRPKTKRKRERPQPPESNQNDVPFSNLPEQARHYTQVCRDGSILAKLVK